MNISKYIKSLPIAALLIASSLSLGSCTKIEPSLFTQDTNTRTDERVLELKKQLTSAEHGWIMEYYPSSFLSYGGYVMGLRFDAEGNVLISSEHMQKPGEKIISKRSMYTIGTDRSVTLNFSTYNPHLHSFGDPGIPYGQGYGAGYEGDHEFILEKPTGDEGLIRLMGKKTHNIIYLRKASEPVEDYLHKALELSQEMFTAATLLREHKEALVGTLGGRKVELEPSAEGYNLLHLIPKEGEDKPRTIPYVLTLQGIRFYNEVEGVSELQWSASDKTFVSAKGDKLIARDDPTYPMYASYLGDYIFSYEAGGGQKITHHITFEADGRHRYLITGKTLPFPIRAFYNAEHERFEIHSQSVDSGVVLAVWAVPDKNNLAWGEGMGMYAKLVEGSNPKEYTMVDNGVWSSFVAKSYVLWKTGKGGVADYPGFPGRIVLPKFTRKN